MMLRRLSIAVAVTAVPAAMLVAQAQPAEPLRAPDAFAGIRDREARSIALFTEMGKVIQHPRCLNCHPRTDSPTQGERMTPHNPPVVRGPDNHGPPGMECATCHGPANVKLVGVSLQSMPGHPDWHLAPKSMAWVGVSLGDICRQIKDPARNGGKTLEQIHHHHAEDTLVGWGWNPGEGREPAPGTQQRFGELTRAWIDSGAACPK